MKEQLNPKYFTPRGFLYPVLIEDMKNIIRQNESEWLIEFEDITEIFIYGRNIEGNYSNNESLIIYLYFEGLISDHEHLKNFIRNLQKELRKNVKYEIDFNLTLKISDQNPREYLYKYFDLINNNLIINREYRKQFSRKKEPKIYIQAEKEPIEYPEKEKLESESKRSQPIFPTIIAKPTSFEDFIETLKGESNKIKNYTERSVKEINEKLLKSLDFETRKDEDN